MIIKFQYFWRIRDFLPGGGHFHKPKPIHPTAGRAIFSAFSNRQNFFVYDSIPMSFGEPPAQASCCEFIQSAVVSHSCVEIYRTRRPDLQLGPLSLGNRARRRRPINFHRESDSTRHRHLERPCKPCSNRRKNKKVMLKRNDYKIPVFLANPGFFAGGRAFS